MKNSVRSYAYGTMRNVLVSAVCARMNVANSAGGNFAYAYDAISRPVARNDDAFGYNARSEVTSATIGGISSVYGYDEIGNSTNWTANCLNQYRHCVYDADGNMTACGPWSYTYDSANRLATVSSNGVHLVTNSYDTRSRRVRKITPEATTTFFYDDWNLVEERVAYANGSTSTIHYYYTDSGRAMLPTMQELINRSTWRTSMCPNAKVEVK